MIYQLKPRHQFPLNATVHCFIGCSIDEALVLIIDSILSWRNEASIDHAPLIESNSRLSPGPKRSSIWPGTDSNPKWLWGSSFLTKRSLELCGSPGERGLVAGSITMNGPSLIKVQDSRVGCSGRMRRRRELATPLE